MVANELEEGVCLDPIPHILILFGFDAAGGVDKGSAGVEMGDNRGQDIELDLGQTTDLGCHRAVAGFHTAGEDSRVGAWDIGEDEVDPVVEGFFEFVHMADEDFSVAVEDIHEGIETAGIDFHGDDVGVWESLAELAGLGALACTIIDNSIVVTIGDRVDNGAARGVLDAEGWVGVEEAGEVGARAGVDSVGWRVVGLEVFLVHDF